MSRLAVCLITTLIGVISIAETFRFNRKVSTTSQDVAFLTERLTQILEPVGYTLVLDSIDVNEEVYHPAVTRPVIIETHRYAVMSVHFNATKGENIYQGMTYLLIFRHDRGPMDDFEFNSSALTVQSRFQNVEATLLLSVGYTQDWFSIEVRPNNLNLRSLKPINFCANILRK